MNLQVMSKLNISELSLQPSNLNLTEENSEIKHQIAQPQLLELIDKIHNLESHPEEFKQALTELRNNKLLTVPLGYRIIKHLNFNNQPQNDAEIIKEIFDNLLIQTPAIPAKNLFSQLIWTQSNTTPEKDLCVLFISA
jgi:hypothetical protein